MIQEVSIETAAIEDFNGIRRVVHDVWPVAYKTVITPQQIDYMLRMMYDDESLLKQMMEENCEFILAKVKDEIVGFASYSEMASGEFKLHKLYVLTSQQGKNTGRRLLDEVCNRATKHGGKRLELQVNKKNEPAINFYHRNNFIIDHEDVFDIGNGFVMDDYIMVKHLALDLSSE